jgi:hypothetical protein
MSTLDLPDLLARFGIHCRVKPGEGKGGSRQQHREEFFDKD